MGSKTTVQQAPLSAEEAKLMSFQSRLAQEQLKNVRALQPFQQELLELSLADLRRTSADNAALDAAISPADRAALQKEEFERSKRLGPIQDELMQLQLDEIRRGGAASPEQLARIKEATDRGIEAGSADIDLSTQRGIGLISDELANSRGLRLSDSPITGEAAMLVRAGEDQKANLIKNLRAGEASAALNFPLAAGQIMSGINSNAQQLTQAAQSFQADLRARAQANRMAMTGMTGQTGIGLANVSGGFGGRSTGSSTSSRGIGLGEVGMAAGGIGGLLGAASGLGWLGGGGAASGIMSMGPISLGLLSDKRLKRDHGVVAKTRDGINVHAYRYKHESDSDPLRLGVMAQDVEKVKPQAVLTRGDGLKFVDYSRL